MSNLFMGDYVEVLKVMSKRIGVDFVLIERKNINSEVHHYCIEKNIQYELVDNASDVNKFIKGWNVVFVASFGLLLKSDFINSCQIIFNFHPGNVFNCRGRHPLPVAIKRGDQSVAVSIHLIDSESIDLGALFSQYFIALDYESSYAYNYKRLLKSLSFLTEQLCAHLEDGSVPPLWNWTPNENSYHDRLPANELDEIINAQKLRDINL